jgi:hypothetical protein
MLTASNFDKDRFASGAEKAAAIERAIQQQIDCKEKTRKKVMKTGGAMQAGARPYPEPPFPKQHRPKPGKESYLEPTPMYDAPHYKGSEKLKGKVALKQAIAIGLSEKGFLKSNRRNPGVQTDGENRRARSQCPGGASGAARVGGFDRQHIARDRSAGRNLYRLLRTVAFTSSLGKMWGRAEKTLWPALFVRSTANDVAVCSAASFWYLAAQNGIAHGPIDAVRNAIRIVNPLVF